nr:hypothetical protein M1L25_000895 [Wolbachia endosymbiont of Ostrinia furnacalis]
MLSCHPSTPYSCHSSNPFSVIPVPRHWDPENFTLNE